MRRYLFLFALATLTLAACRVESNVILDIRADGSASVGAEIGFDEEFRNIVEGVGADPQDILSELPSFGGEDVVAIQRTEGDLMFFGAMSEIDDLSSYDFAGSSQQDLFTEFSFEFDGETARLAANVNAGEFGEGGDLPIDPSQISADLISANVIVTMPGRIIEHDADEVRSDGTLVWNISLTGPTSIFASSSLGSSGSSAVWWLAGSLILLGLVGGTFALGKSRKHEQQAVAAAAVAHEAELGQFDQNDSPTGTTSSEELNESLTDGPVSAGDSEPLDDPHPETT